MSLSLLAACGVIVAFAISYLSNLRSSAEGSSAVRFALSLPIAAVSAVAAVKPESVFALSAIGRESGVSLRAVSKYPHGELAISDQALVFGAQDASLWAYFALALAGVILIVTWLDHRVARRGETRSKSVLIWLLAAWAGIWVARFAGFPMIPGEISAGQDGLRAFLQFSASSAQADQYLLPKEAWIYAPEQWYLSLIGFGAALCSLISLFFTPRAIKRGETARIASPLLTALAAASVVMIAVFGASEAHLGERSSLWLAATALSVASLGRFPQLQHQTLLMSALIILAGAC